MKTIICERCGKSFKQSHYPKQRFCSRNCMGISMRGINNGHYKGGTINKTGYKIVCINGKQIYEHRYVMEQYLNRPLSRAEHVHHINRVKNDNRICNLEILSASQHRRIHHNQTFRNETHKECTRCHEIKERNMFGKYTGSQRNTDKNLTHCKSCVAAYVRNRLHLGLTVQWRDRHKNT